MVADAFGAAPNPGTMACVRRVFYESYTLAAQDLRGKLSSGSTEDDKVKRLPAPERHQRFTTLQARITGISLDRPNEPADSVVDIYCDM